MTLAGPASAPMGFLEYCEREPIECTTATDRPGSASETEAIVHQARDQRWRQVLAFANGSRPRSPQPASNDLTPSALLDAAGPEPLHQANGHTTASAPSSAGDLLEANLVQTARREISKASVMGVSGFQTLVEQTPGRDLPFHGQGLIAGLSSGLSKLDISFRPNLEDEGLRDRLGPLGAPGFELEASTPDPVILAPIRVRPAPSDGRGVVLPLTPDLWATLQRIDDHVNGAIIRATDQQIYGVADYWTAPLKDGRKTAYGDCEDFVLEKRRELVAEGVPLSALSIAVVALRSGEEHAVLLVATDKGELVLDSLSPWIDFWAQAPYRWEERQMPGATFEWAAIDVPSNRGH